VTNFGRCGNTFAGGLGLVAVGVGSVVKLKFDGRFARPGEVLHSCVGMKSFNLSCLGPLLRCSLDPERLILRFKLNLFWNLGDLLL
ncbi:unnamed protein product, partial [Rotaria magnacalcarata]